MYKIFYNKYTGYAVVAFGNKCLSHISDLQIC